MANIRHVVVVRKDLQMPPGLLAAQVAHICDGFMRKLLTVKPQQDGVMSIIPTQNELDWCCSPYLSVLAVNCFEDLCEILEDANREKLPVYEWRDLIPSPTIEGKSIRAFVGLSIGPCDFDMIKIVTGALEPD